MPHPPGQHIGDCFETPVRVIREPGQVIVRVVGTKFIQHQEWVQAPLQVGGQHPQQFDAGAIGHRLASHPAFDFATAESGFGYGGVRAHVQCLQIQEGQSA